MSDSQTKKQIIQQHLSNKLLQAPILLPAQRSTRDLSADQPTMQPDMAIIERAVNALKQGKTHYAEVPGIAPLREKLAGYLQEMGLTGYKQANILVTAGIQEGRFLSIQKIGELSGSIGLPTVVHPGARKAAGVRSIKVMDLPVDVENGMLPTAAGLRAALEQGCKLLYIESPVRLTGAVYDAAAVEAIAALVETFDAAVIWDQGLSPWVETDSYFSLGAQPGMAERVAVLGEAWPGVGLESWFIGYLGINENWMEGGGVRAQKQVMSICTSTPSQYAALEAAERYAHGHREQVKLLARHRQEALAIARNIGTRPLTGASVNLLALQMLDIQQAGITLQAAGFTIADGNDFGAPDVIRLTVTADNTVAQALNQLVLDE